MWIRKNNLTPLFGNPVSQRALQSFMDTMVGIHGVMERIRTTGVTDNAVMGELIDATRQGSVLLNSLLLNVPLSAYEHRYGAQAVAERHFVNIGSGSHWTHPAWRTLDIKESIDAYAHAVDFRAKQRLPFDDGFARLVYSSHCLEHLDQAAVENVLAEAFRILQPGGMVRIVLPDAALFVEACRAANMAFFRNVVDYADSYDGLSVAQVFLSSVAAPCSIISKGCEAHHMTDDEVVALLAGDDVEAALDTCIKRYPPDIRLEGNPHINWFTHGKLSRMLGQAGFTEITPSAFGKSRELVLCDTMFFDATAPEVSIFMEAVKPGG